MGPLIETVTIQGTRLTLSSYRTRRRTGRRLIVKNQYGTVLYDTDDCYDLGNAVNAVDLWLQSENGKQALADYALATELG